MTVAPLFFGFTTGLSLIVAIGAQNAFVLRQGIRREHVFVTALVCFLSDAVLIFAGVGGMGVLVERVPWLLVAARLGGFLFLGTYAVFAFRRAIKPDSLKFSGANQTTGVPAVILTTLALTWLNPHVYIDTVLLLGSVAVSQGTGARWFALGAIGASLIWFFALAYAACFLAPLFAKPKAWQVLDVIIGLLMSFFAILLIWPVFTM
ncbi:LysE/ArgO family amino acid transporter [Arthrobacter sp. NIO-1057]|uniref:LysE/ArgO family amino acid transporter n=1 Tax=Arthrobacter sp. NIO-1057 TaxID=993071 RepID=UPI00071DA0D6|nr:LysE/ArgO family amino acid transporter [Arthrobacter sp. NIO-1057]KSU65097.1 amino acid transporter [Arthrobacter sp. NIO-1057]SCC47330.1 L-lysine exporter family protein LysE/ArgO [Arthrobacter sp. NIO-1057]